MVNELDELRDASLDCESHAVERLEQAVNRIAYALDRRAAAPATDLHMVAANIDVLRARIRAVLGDEQAG